MTEENGHGRTAVLYARPSTDDQPDRAYSVNIRLSEPREHSERASHEVVEEVVDGGELAVELGEKYGPGEVGYKGCAHERRYK